VLLTAEVLQRVTFGKSKSHSAMKEDGTFAKFQAEQRLKAKGIEPAAKKARTGKHGAAAAAGGAIAAAAPGAADAAASSEPEVPHTILYLENLPKETTQPVIEMLFDKLPGFKEVRVVPGRPDIAFVEYDSLDNAAHARATMQSFPITSGKHLKISFAKH
jgi:U2 small nuclear ribonucleoprotein B''